jgi:hut operon positive regulatory protein
MNAEHYGIGKIALLLALSDEYEILKEKYEEKGYTIYKGNAGSMDAKKIYAAIETAAFREDIIRENYHEEHSLYHATQEALEGYCRGQVVLGDVLRTVGLIYVLVRGKLIDGDASSGEWIALVLFGQIGSPRKGFEHEAIGMGIQPI